MTKSKQQAAYQPQLDAYNAAAKQVFEASQKAFTGYDELAAMSKANFEAVLATNQAVFANAERVTKLLFGKAQQNWEANLALFQALAGAKTVQDVTALQSDYVQTAADKAIAESAELTELFVASAKDVAKPLQAQAQVVAEKLQKPLAV